ncbi:MAG: NAD-dependent epimerase/dehydratase family protein [Leptolyngbyaceae cyanobacterium MO_188.B28]|nr:NAD-dependent epimerase/dehydratase family protein [Leptolyngbyaceae cyanobacterium MO_188.B28]
MKALVTGANGFSGSHLVKALERQGHSVVGLVRQSSNLSRLANTNVRLVYGDITDRQALKTAMAEVDTIFHLAALVDLGLVNEAEMERVNVAGTQAVLEVAQEMGGQSPKIVYCSTIGVFGDTNGQTIDETFQRTQSDFSSAYDRTKFQAQQLVDQAAQQGLWVVSVLPAGILGPDDPHFGPVMKLFLSGRLLFWPGGQRVTGIVHVDDVVNAMILAVERGQSGERYILSTGDLTTQNMFGILSQETGLPIPSEPPQFLIRLIGQLLDPVGRLFNWNPPLSSERVHYIYDRCVRVDASKARQALGWRPRSVENTLQEIIREMQAAE